MVLLFALWFQSLPVPLPDRSEYNFFFFFTLWTFFTSVVFHWSLSDSKSLQVSRTLLSILADLNNAIVWMVSTCPLIYKSSCHFINSSVTVPRTPITVGIIVTFMFYSFFGLVWFVWFYGISTFVGYLTPNPFLCK